MVYELSVHVYYISHIKLSHWVAYTSHMAYSGGKNSLA